MGAVVKMPSWFIVRGKVVVGFSDRMGSSTARTSHCGAYFLISALMNERFSSEKRSGSWSFQG